MGGMHRGCTDEEHGYFGVDGDYGDKHVPMATGM